MNPWPFVISSYAIVLLGAVAVSLWAWRAARAAEARVDAQSDRD
jgi:hypothetical protein